MFSFVFVDFSKSNEKLPQISFNDKKYETIHPGYNYEAICPNEDCPSIGEYIICPMMKGK